MNKLVRHNLVRGLPTKCFENDHTCTACIKEKQHKASCKSKLVNSVSKPPHTLHMDLFGPTSISSISHKWYCLVVTDDFSRFTWTFFLKTKDETSGILRKFITEIENLKDLKVKIIRTLIEAARTMLADAKLPVTFWAEAVNTTCYVQNRFLVNKSQNKTPYELSNGRTPAIGFLKPFGCHVMILNTLDNLGKFEAKGYEGYFIRYSMSSKAFRVFSKRTRKVEKNLHVEFLENKAVEKGAGPNWLFDIDSLTKSMNYVPVDAGTNSTNLSGIKDAVSQEVKKDVSSLRYTGLPNWIHDALLKSSSSKPQDDCSTNVPESSGNSNPTATLTNPPADQLETLTVETPIPTVSSPVPTACFTESPEPLSDARLISKRVTNQVETPSLDNILTLANRFEDILGVTTNSDEPNRVEADVSNMETTITASPTPTLRIHKDHPKSQIIGLVDTPIQTRNKSKEVEAMQEELLQFKIQIVWTLVDCPKECTQMDMKSAFLYGTINEEVYVMQPLGFQDPKFPAKVYKVEKAMYGLHQAPRAWYGTLSKYLLTNGFQRGTIDQTLFIRREFEALMHEKFQMSVMDQTSCLLFVPVPVKRIFRYLKVHTKLGLWYPKKSPFDLVAYSDSDYGGATQDHKSTTEGCQFLGRRLISWQCKKQTIVATSTTEAEYVAAANLLTKPFNAGRFQYLVSEHNVDSHSIVDFVEASPLRYALTIKPTVYVSHIRQFWYTARIETTEEGTKILATVDGILRTVTESSLRRNLKLQYEEGISSLPDKELFENLTLMGYKISPNQKFTFQKGFNEFSSNIATALVCLATNRTYKFSKMIFNGLVKNVNNKGEGSGTPTEPHHIPSPEAHPTLHTTHSSSTLPPVTTDSIPTVTPSKTTPIRHYTRRARIAQSLALPPVADESTSPLRDVSEGEACPTESSLGADKDRANIAKTSTLPHDSAPRVTSHTADEGSLQLKLDELMDLCTSLLNARVKLLEDIEGVDAERSGDDAPIKGRNLDEGEAVADRVSDDIEEMATILTSMEIATILASGAAEVPTSSRSIPTAGSPAAEFPTGSDVVPTASPVFATATVVTPCRRRKGKEIMVASETPKKKKVARDADVARIHVEEELQMMINSLDRSNETVLKYLQEKIWSKKKKRDYYMAVIKSNFGWKVKDFKGITFEEIEAKFTTVWKQLKDFIPMGSQEEAEMLKRKGLSLEQESMKKLKTSEEVPKEVKSPDEVLEEKVKEMMQLVPIEEVEDLNQLWALVNESLSNRPPTIEWKLYDLCGVHQVISKDKEIFILMKKDYPLRKGLAIVMICYKLQVENYSQMANDLILKIYKIENCPSQQVIEFPLPEEVLTASKESSHSQKKREATSVKDFTTTKVKKKLSVKVK
nr:hypothetical protein [Tanacetum cinerariifolium]